MKVSPIRRSYHDDRGDIIDLAEHVDAATLITTAKGAVRGNHIHRRTWQWTYVLTGKLRVAGPAGEGVVGAGEMVLNEPGEPHAWQALEDTTCLVFARGPRAGNGYEDDTERLAERLL